MPHVLPWGLVLADVLPVCYTDAVLVTFVFLMTFDLLQGALVCCHLGLYVARFRVVVLVRVLVGILCPHTDLPS